MMPALAADTPAPDADLAQFRAAYTTGEVLIQSDGTPWRPLT